jgi:hypothetical protein
MRGWFQNYLDSMGYADSTPTSAPAGEPGQPGFFETLSSSSQTMMQSAASLTKSVSTAGTIALYGVVGIGLLMLWRESETHEGRERVARGAGHAASGAVSTAAKAGGTAARAFL